MSRSRTTTDVFLVEEGTVETMRGEVAPYIDGDDINARYVSITPDKRSRGSRSIMSRTGSTPSG